MDSNRLASKLILVVIAIIACICLFAALLPGCQQQKPMPTQDTQGVQPKEPAIVEETASTEPETSQSQAMQKAEDAVKKIVEPYGDSVAVAVLALDGGEGFSINGGQRFVSASMIKLLILAELMAQVDAGSVSLSETHALRADEIVGGTGVIGNMGAGTTFTIDKLAHYMIAESDNTATNILIDRLGMSSINSRASKLGLKSTDLQRKMMDLNSGVENHMSADDAAKILAGIANGAIASTPTSNTAIEYLCAQSDNEALAAGLSGARFGHKTGTLENYRHDAGIVFADEPYVIAVFTKGASSPNGLMSQIASTVQKYLG